MPKKTFLTIMISFLAVSGGSSFAQSQASAVIGATINIVEPINIAVERDILLPSVAVDQANVTVSSDDTRSRNGAEQPHNAKLSISGQSNVSYSVTIEGGSNRVALGNRILMDLEIVDNAGSRIRTLNKDGKDSFQVRGKIAFNNSNPVPRTPGAYTGNATILVQYE